MKSSETSFVDLHHQERPVRRGRRQSEHVGHEGGGLLLVADVDQRVVELDDHVPSSGRVVEHLAQPAGERLGLAGVAELAADEAAVMAREHGRLLPEQRRRWPPRSAR